MSATPDNLPPLREVIARHGLRAKKSMGQNFLLDLNLTRKIARSAAPLQEHAVVEIGPGPGGLTRALLLEGAERVIAIERDARALPALEEVSTRWPGKLHVVHGDALRVDWPALVAEHAAGLPVKIVANLPYNIATPLLTDWLTTSWPPFWRSLTLMFQREVAERITARPGGKTYGRLAVLSQWRATARVLLEVPPAAFTPPPRVVSAVVRITPRQAPACPRDVATLERLTEAAFGQRRKMLRQSLRRAVGAPLPLLESAGIAPTMRAEELTVDDFVRLACLVEEMSHLRERDS